MENIDIPNIPLAMPEKENLYKEPKHPYQYITHGIIRGKEYGELLETMHKYYQEPEELQIVLEGQFSYHIIKDLFPDWNLQELGDFCRHILIINKDALGWDLVDNVLLVLNNITIPGWRLPNFDFIGEFKNVLNQIQKIYFPDRLRDLIEGLLEETKIEEIQFDKDVKKHLHLWSIKDLWLLLSYLIKQRNNIENNIGVQQIINLIASKFEELIESGKVPVKQTICLVLLYIDAMDGIDKRTTMRSKDLIDMVWTQMKELPYSEKISFKYLLGAAYSMVGQHLFKQDTDFVTRKLFIDNFIHSYVAEEYDLGRWFADLLNYDLDELIFDLLIRGYSQTIPLLHMHMIELPPSRTRDQIELRITQFNEVLADIVLYYLDIPPVMDNLEIAMMYEHFLDQLRFEKTRSNMVELLYRVTTSAVFYNENFSEERKMQLYKATSYLLEHQKDSFRATLFGIDYYINNGQYKFEELYQKMQVEVTEFQSLVLSPTFEQEIVQKISMTIEYTEKLNTREDLYLEIYEIILQFLLRWLEVFSRNKDDFKEVLMIFSPLINICFFQQIRWYYENNFLKKAFLMNVNLHAFMNYVSQRIDRFDHMTFKKIEVSTQKGMSEKYREITKKWQIRDLLKQIQIKEMIIDTRHQFKKSGLQRKQEGNLIEDALIHGYLDEIDRLEQFISTDYSKRSSETLEHLLYTSGIYKPGDMDKKYRLERIGGSHIAEEIIPVPLFNNVHKLSIAAELFEIKPAKIDQIQEKNENIQKNYARVS